MALSFAYHNYCRSHITLNERMGYSEAFDAKEATKEMRTVK